MLSKFFEFVFLAAVFSFFAMGFLIFISDLLAYRFFLPIMAILIIIAGFTASFAIAKKRQNPKFFIRPILFTAFGFILFFYSFQISEIRKEKFSEGYFQRKGNVYSLTFEVPKHFAPSEKEYTFDIEVSRICDPYLFENLFQDESAGIYVVTPIDEFQVTAYPTQDWVHSSQDCVAGRGRYHSFPFWGVSKDYISNVNFNLREGTYTITFSPENLENIPDRYIYHVKLLLYKYRW